MNRCARFRTGIQSSARLQHGLPALRRRRLRHTPPHKPPEIPGREHPAKALRRTTTPTLQPHLRIPGRPDSDLAHSRGHLRPGLPRRGANEPRSSTTLRAHPHPRPPWLPGRQRPPPAGLPPERLQRLPGNHPHPRSPGLILPPLRLRNHPRRNPPPGSLFYAGCLPPILAERTFATPRSPLWTALLLLWTSLWLVLVASGSM